MGYQSKITSKGQTTIPQEVRDYLKLKPGDRVQYVFNGGSVVMIPKNRSIADLAGILGAPPRGAGATLEEIDEAIGKFVAEDDERISREWHEGRK
jgi:antitoxin PrlF